jgi:exodeoxyribonuclease V alpha subunit
MPTIDETLDKLSRSKFRSSFKLTKKERAYLDEKGIEVMRSHAQDFVRQKLAPANPVNDGKQTPMHGHPVFKAMHATACCCRECLNKWYRIPKGQELTEDQQDRIVKLLLAWLERELSKQSP